jgi:hypothetical protein
MGLRMVGRLVQLHLSAIDTWPLPAVMSPQVHPLFQLDLVDSSPTFSNARCQGFSCFLVVLQDAPQDHRRAGMGLGQGTLLDAFNVDTHRRPKWTARPGSTTVVLTTVQALWVGRANGPPRWAHRPGIRSWIPPFCRDCSKSLPHDRDCMAIFRR